MNVSSLADFLAIIDAGSLAAAARATGTPKSTLSKRLADLERALGVRLVERSTRSLRPTDDGLLLKSRATRLMAEFGELERMMRDRAETPAGRLRISTPLLFGQLHMASLAAAYRRSFPGVSIEVVMSDRRVDLIEEDFDCAIRVGDLPDSELVARRFATSRRVLVAAPSLLEGRPVPARPADLSAFPVVARPGAANDDWQLECGARRETLRLPAMLTFDSLISVRDAAIEGAGIAFIPDTLAADALADGRLVRLLPDWHGPESVLSLVYPSRRHVPARLSAFVDLLAAWFRPGGGVAPSPAKMGG